MGERAVPSYALADFIITSLERYQGADFGAISSSRFTPAPER
jgi:hypothetical protein